MNQDNFSTDIRSFDDHQKTSISLIDRLQNRERLAWERFATLYGPMIYGWSRKMGHQPADADDLTQEVLAAVDFGVYQFVHNGRLGAFRKWLKTIYLNERKEYLRRQMRGAGGGVGGTDFKIEFEQFADETLDDSESEISEELQVMFRAIELIKGDFDDGTWQTFKLLMIEGMTPREISEANGVKENAVRQTKFRVIQKLKEEFADLLNISLLTSSHSQREE